MRGSGVSPPSMVRDSPTGLITQVETTCAKSLGILHGFEAGLRAANYTGKYGIFGPQTRENQ